MEMFVRVSKYRIVPTRGIVDITIFPESEGGWDGWESFPARSLRVDIVTSATSSYHDDGGDDGGNAHTAIMPYTIILQGAEAQTFLDALPTYSPAREEARG